MSERHRKETISAAHRSDRTATFGGTVESAGGKLVSIWVDTDTMEYPAVGERVTVYCRGPEETKNRHPWKAGRVPYACPRCLGLGRVSFPGGIPGDLECNVCGGECLVWG